MTAKRSGGIRWTVAGLIFLTMGIHLALAGDKVSRMTKEELKDMLGKPEVAIIDVRATSDWTKSDQKILGAVREDPSKPTKSWAEKYPKDKTIVLYCA